VLNQVYANVLQKPILVPKQDVTSLGSAIFAFLAAGAFKSVEEAQDALGPSYVTIEPEARSRPVYDELFGHFRRLYFGFGSKDSAAAAVGSVLPSLRRLAAEAKAS
ncbi:MAG TPA: ribulokinase, partial [Terriglobales bacterium]|nr:ribulokinase [Terriglobales bacterium]